MTSNNNKVDTDSAEAPDKGVGCGALVRRPARPRKLDVLTCELVGCVGGHDGCNGSQCRNATWQKMTPEEYQEHFREPAPNLRRAAASTARVANGRNKQRSPLPSVSSPNTPDSATEGRSPEVAL